MLSVVQEPLIDVPPVRSRRIIVPAGHSAWWGADVSVSRLALAYASCEGAHGARTVLFADLKGGARLAHIWAETGLLVAEAVRDGWPLPGLVWVEQPSGAQPNPQLSYVTGAIQGAVFAGVQRVTGRPVRVETVSSASWKKTSCGYGAIYKPTKKKLGRAPRFEDYGVARWAAGLGYGGASWDECDALGIAEAARRTVALEER
jgi:hypothetical protein